MKTNKIGFKEDFILLFIISSIAFLWLCINQYNNPKLSINRADKMDCIMVEDGDTLSARGMSK